MFINDHMCTLHCSALVCTLITSSFLPRHLMFDVPLVVLHPLLYSYHRFLWDYIMEINIVMLIFFQIRKQEINFSLFDNFISKTKIFLKSLLLTLSFLFSLALFYFSMKLSFLVIQEHISNPSKTHNKENMKYTILIGIIFVFLASQ